MYETLDEWAAVKIPMMVYVMNTYHVCDIVSFHQIYNDR